MVNIIDRLTKIRTVDFEEEESQGTIMFNIKKKSYLSNFWTNHLFRIVISNPIPLLIIKSVVPVLNETRHPTQFPPWTRESAEVEYIKGGTTTYKILESDFYTFYRSPNRFFPKDVSHRISGPNPRR